MDIKTIDGDDLPDEVKKALMAHIMGGGGKDHMRPARLADLQGLLEGTHQPRFEVGDIVQLRPFAKGRFKWPTEDDRCIVTQVLDTPYRTGEPGTFRPAVSHNIALAFVDEDDDDLMEFLHDSRLFVKVGSIYDPITLANGEAVPVE